MWRDQLEIAVALDFKVWGLGFWEIRVYDFRVRVRV